jgi:hypothetical protein
MNQDQPLRRLLDELQAAEAERQGEVRDSPAYAEAQRRVDRLMEDVWKEAAGSARGSVFDGEAPEGSTDL